MPSALSIGISYELFWHLTPNKLIPFTKAHALKRQERMDDMWIMGQHIASALDATVCNAMPFVKRKRKGKYLEKPIRIIPLTEEEKREAEERELRKFLGFADGFEKNVKSKFKGE